MSLPVCQVATDTVRLPDGQDAAIRGLSRAEAIQVRLVPEDAPGGRVAAMEKLVLGAGLDASPEDVDAWYAVTSQDAVEVLVNAIARLSGLDPDQGKAEGAS